MTDLPLAYRWTGEGFVPVGRSIREADKRFVVGERYRLEVIEERSAASHRHYFASIREGWENLPDAIALEFASPDALRKRALIETGFYDERRFASASPEEARNLAIWLRPKDAYAVYAVHGNVVIERTAKSQSTREMGRQQFQDSKEKTLAWIADLIGVDVQALSSNTRNAA